MVMGGVCDRHLGFLASAASVFFGHGRASLEFHAATEDAIQRQAHKRDCDGCVDARGLPVVDWADLKIMLGHAERCFHLTQAAKQVQHRRCRIFRTHVAICYMAFACFRCVERRLLDSCRYRRNASGLPSKACTTWCSVK